MAQVESGTLTLREPKGPNGEPRPRAVDVRIAYGGRIKLRELQLTRADGESAWRLDAATIRDFASLRWIQRRDAARVEKP